MMISRMNSTYNNINTRTQSVDNDSKSLQTKLVSQQRRLKAVDSDTNMDDNQKAKEKLKIQQQIDDLNRKLKMEELEKEPAEQKPNVQKEDVKAKLIREEDSKEEKIGITDTKESGVEKNSRSLVDEEKTEAARESLETKATKEKSDAANKEEKSAIQRQIEEAKEAEEKSKQEKLGISPQELHKMFSADFELQRERVLNNVSSKKDGVEDVLRAEIKSDEIQGTDTADKKEKLVQMRNRKPIQIETVDSDRKDKVAKAQSGAKVVIREDAIV